MGELYFHLKGKRFIGYKVLFGGGPEECRTLEISIFAKASGRFN